MENRFISIYQSQSNILAPGAPSMMTEFVVKGNLDNLRSHMLRIKGGTDGDYLNSQGKRVPAKLIQLKEQKKNLEDQWERFCQSRIAVGEPKPKIWPEHLQEKKDKLQARLQVAQEEIAWLEKEIGSAEVGEAARKKKVVSPQHWGAGQLRNGELIEFCGWSVSPDSSGLLRILDPSSPFNGLAIWRLKSQVVNPLHYEYRVRMRKEAGAAQAENRKRKEVKFPKPPTFDQKSGNIEYPGDYDPSTIRKLKLQDENI